MRWRKGNLNGSQAKYVEYPHRCWKPELRHPRLPGTGSLSPSAQHLRIRKDSLIPRFLSLSQHLMWSFASK